MQKNKAIQMILYVSFVLLCITCKTTRPPNPPPSPPPPPATIDGGGIMKDSDGDGIGDSEDQCPAVAGVIKYKGCPVPDTDGDGVNDELDKCPDTPGNESSAGCPHADTAYLVDGIDGVDGGGRDRDSLAMIPGIDDMPTEAAPPPPPPPPVRPHGEKSHEGAEGPAKDSTANVLPANDEAETKKYENTIIAYSYRKKLWVKQPQVFKVLVKLDKGNITVAAVREELKGSLHEDSPESGEDTSKIETIKYFGGKYYEVLLKCEPGIFKVDSMNIPSIQELTEYGNTWEWKVTGLKEVKKENITFTINVLDESKNRKALKTLDIPVSVTVVGGFPYKWIFIILGCIVISLLVFLLMKKRVVPDTSIYFSYAWDDNKRTGIIERLDKSLKSSDFITIRDADNLEPHERISEFMTRIGNANFVIVGLSDNYIKSRFCIYELYRIYINSKQDPSEFKSRIFPIRMDDLNLSDNINNYVLYWQAESKKLFEERSVDYNNIKTIADDLEQLLGNLADVLAFNLDTVEKNDFAEIKSVLRRAIDKKIKS